MESRDVDMQTTGDCPVCTISDVPHLIVRFGALGFGVPEGRSTSREVAHV